MLELRQTLTLSGVEGRRAGAQLRTPRRRRAAALSVGAAARPPEPASGSDRRTRRWGGWGGGRCECAIGEYVTNRSIIFPQYDLSRKKEEGKKNPLKEFSKCCVLVCRKGTGLRAGRRSRGGGGDPTARLRDAAPVR